MGKGVLPGPINSYSERSCVAASPDQQDSACARKRKSSSIGLQHLHLLVLKAAAQNWAVVSVLFSTCCGCQPRGKEISKKMPVTIHPAWVKQIAFWFLWCCQKKSPEPRSQLLRSFVFCFVFLSSSIKLLCQSCVGWSGLTELESDEMLIKPWWWVISIQSNLVTKNTSFVFPFFKHMYR